MLLRQLVCALASGWKDYFYFLYTMKKGSCFLLKDEIDDVVPSI